MATCSGLSPVSPVSPRKANRWWRSVKETLRLTLELFSTTPRGVQLPSKEDKNLKEEAMPCKPASSVSEENRNLKRAGGGCSWVWLVRRKLNYSSSM